MGHVHIPQGNSSINHSTASGVFFLCANIHRKCWLQPGRLPQAFHTAAVGTRAQDRLADADVLAIAPMVSTRSMIDVSTGRRYHDDVSPLSLDLVETRCWVSWRAEGKRGGTEPGGKTWVY